MRYRTVATLLLLMIAVAASSCSTGNFVARGEVHETEHYLWIDSRDGLLYWEKESGLELRFLGDLSGVGKIFEEEGSVWFETVGGVYRWGRVDGEHPKRLSPLRSLLWIEEKGDVAWTVSSHKICKWDIKSQFSSHCVDNPAYIIDLTVTSEFVWLVGSDGSCFSWPRETLAELRPVTGFSGEINAVAEIPPRVWLAGSGGLFTLDIEDRSKATRVNGPDEALAIKEGAAKVQVLATNGIFEFSKETAEGNARVEEEYTIKRIEETRDSVWFLGHRKLIRWPRSDAENYEEYFIRGEVADVVEAEDFYWAYDFMNIFSSPTRDSDEFAAVAGLTAISRIYPVRGGVWIGTGQGVFYWSSSGGLRRMPISGSRFSFFEVGDYLLVEGAEDKVEGDLFVSSGHRLSVVECNTAEVLTSMRFPYGWLAYAALDDQRLWLFTASGVVEMDPLNVDPRGRLP